MQGWATVGDEIVREVLLRREINVLLVDSRFESGT